MLRAPLALIAACAALGAVATSARAEMPYYDPNSYCRAVASFGGAFSDSTMQTCLRMEQSAYDALKSRWDQLPQHIRAYCDEVARFGGAGSYSTLETCVQMEIRAAQSNRAFKFKR